MKLILNVMHVLLLLHGSKIIYNERISCFMWIAKDFACLVVRQMLIIKYFAP